MNRQFLFIWPSFNLGGAERQALLLAKYLKKNGVAVQIVGFGDPGRAAELCDEAGIPWAQVSIGWSHTRLGRFREALKFGLSLRQFRPDILLPYCWTANINCGISWLVTGAKVSIWNQRDEGRHFKGTRLERLAIALSPRFISNSQHGADFLVHRLNAKREKISVVYNGIELERPQNNRAGCRRQLGVTEAHFLVCMVANLHHYKDHETLLRAWRIVLDNKSRLGRPAVLLLAGRFESTHHLLKALAYDLELGKTVRFLGKVDDVSGLLGAVDLCAHSSCYEGLPNGVLEAMAAGLPLVGTDIPGIREAVGPANFPFLVPPRNAEALAEQILDFEANSSKRVSVGRNNRKRIVNHFASKKMCEDTTSLISDWLEQRR